MRPFLVSAVVASYISTTMADITWPEYSQQCQDDAGPPFMDDSETYNGGKYHDGSSASPVLIDGQCAPTMTAACASRPDAKTAYLEGPIGCQGTGWYCRIVEQEGWAAGTLSGDLNFGHCNSSLSFEDWGYDRDGHCHGSSDDSTYYWWIRDHWFRGYNGRLRCCCGWYTTPSMDGAVPMYSQKIANRCDYRRLVTKTEDVSACRDANEDHGLGFDDIGCDTSLESAQTGSPVPDNDATCWEIHNFGVGSEAYEESSESLEMAHFEALRVRTTLYSATLHDHLWHSLVPHYTVSLQSSPPLYVALLCPAIYSYSILIAGVVPIDANVSFRVQLPSKRDIFSVDSAPVPCVVRFRVVFVTQKFEDITNAGQCIHGEGCME